MKDIFVIERYLDGRWQVFRDSAFVSTDAAINYTKTVSQKDCIQKSWYQYDNGQISLGLGEYTLRITKLNLVE